MFGSFLGSHSATFHFYISDLACTIRLLEGELLHPDNLIQKQYDWLLHQDSCLSWSKTSDPFSFQAAERASIVGYKEEDLAVPPEIPRPIPEVRESYPLWFASITFPCC